MNTVGFFLLAAVAVAFTFYSCTASGPADVSGQSIHHFYLPGYSGCYQENHKSPNQEYWTCMQRRKKEHEEQKAQMILLKEVILSVIQYICIVGLMIVFIIKSNPPVHVSSFFSQIIYACDQNTIKATMDLPSPIKPRRVVEDTIPPVHVISFFPPTIYACYRKTIEATMDLPSPIKPRRVKRCIIVDDSIDLTPVRSKTVALMDAKYRMRLQRACRRQLFK